MKKPFEEHLTDAGRELHLSTNERARMRATLSEYMAYKPIRSTNPARVQRIFAYIHHPAFALASILLMVTVSMSGVAYAAESSLPGSVLYPVKVDVVEPVQSLLAVSPAAQATLHMQLAEKRIEEAALLAKQGALATSTEQALVQNFSSQVQQVNTALDTERATNPSTTDIASTKFAARLGAYTSVLADANRSSHSYNNSNNNEDTAPTFRAAIASSITQLGSDENASSSPNATGAQATSSPRTTTNKGRAPFNQKNPTGAAQAFTNELEETERASVFAHAASALGIDVLTATSTIATSTSATSSESSASRNRNNENRSNRHNNNSRGR